jgi:hypothetical protein
MNKKKTGQSFIPDIAAHPKGMPPADVIKSEVLRMGLSKEDAEAIIDYWLANGFKTGRNKVQSWTAVLRTWKANKWFPSQKRSKDTSEDNRARQVAEFKELRKRLQDDRGNRLL